MRQQPRAPAPVLLVGPGSATLLQTARLLSARGVPVIALADDRRHFACRTRAVQRVVEVQTDEPTVVDVVLELAATLPVPPVVLPCSDGSVLALSRDRDRLGTAVRLPLPDPDLLEDLVDKVRFARWASREGLPVPASVPVRSLDDLARVHAMLSPPYLVKPAVKTSRWQRSTTRKVLEVPDRPTLDRAVEEALTWSPSLLVQEPVPGDGPQLFTCNVAVGPDGDIRCSFVSRKLRQWPVGTGTGSCAVEERNPAVEALARRIFERPGYRGLGYVEVKRTPADDHQVIEVNVGRPTGRSAMAEAGGVELLLSMYRDALGLAPLPMRLRTQRYDGVRWAHRRRDLPAAVAAFHAHELDVATWWRTAGWGVPDAVFSWRDPLPFAADVVRTLPRPTSPTRRQAVG
jgi:D-aspartate ligase